MVPLDLQTLAVIARLKFPHRSVDIPLKEEENKIERITNGRARFELEK